MTVRRNLAVVPDRPLRVVAYRRVSALMGRGGDDFHSPEVQIAAIRRKTLGMQEVGVIDDIDRTGTNFSREGIEQIRRLAAAKAFDVLAVFNISRFGRNTLESLQVLNELADHGVTIISAKEHVDTSTPTGRKHLTDLLSLAQMRSEEIGEAWSEIAEQRFEAGLQHAHAPAGYIKVDKTMVVDPALGWVMAEVFRRYAAGASAMEVTRFYGAHAGGRVSRRQMRARLRNPVYVGRVRRGKREQPGVHEPLVDEETWQKVQERMDLNTTIPPRHRTPTWGLAGLLRCAVCGSALHRLSLPRDKTGARVDRLRCGLTKLQVAGGCDGVGQPALAKVEEAVLQCVARYMADLRTDPAARAASLARKATAQADVTALERELAKVRKARAKLQTAWALDEHADDDVYRASATELREAEALLATELESARQTVAVPDGLQVANAAEAILAMWPEMTVAEKGEALRTVLKRVTVRKSTYRREPEADRIVPVWL